MTGKEEPAVLARVAQLTSHQIAECIIETDLASQLDSLGYFDRRMAWTDDTVRTPSGSARYPAALYPAAENMRW